MDNIKPKLLKRAFICIKGAFLWRRLLRKYKEINNTAVIIIPENDDCRYFALKYLDRMLCAMKFDNAVILSCDEEIARIAESFSDKISRVVDFSVKKSKILEQYYMLFEFDRRIIFASLDIPKGRCGSKLIGLKGLTAEEVFAIGVYRIYPL